MSNEFWQEVERLIKPIPQIELGYRIYYDEYWNITSCSTHNHSEGNYLIVTKDEYENYFRYQIVNKKLVKIDSDAKYRVKLEKSAKGFKVVRGHAGLLIEDEDYTDIEYYARTN